MFDKNSAENHQFFGGYFCNWSDKQEIDSACIRVWSEEPGDEREPFLCCWKYKDSDDKNKAPWIDKKSKVLMTEREIAICSIAFSLYDVSFNYRAQKLIDKEEIEYTIEMTESEGEDVMGINSNNNATVLKMVALALGEGGNEKALAQMLADYSNTLSPSPKSKTKEVKVVEPVEINIEQAEEQSKQVDEDQLLFVEDVHVETEEEREERKNKRKRKRGSRG